MQREQPLPDVSAAEGTGQAPWAERVAVAADSCNRETGRALAARLGLVFLDAELDRAANIAFILRVGADGLALCSGAGRFGPISSEFATGRLRHRHQFGGGVGQSIARAVGIRQGTQLHIADLTAGLGADAFVLAGLGARVSMIERHPVIAMLLDDGLRRGRELAQSTAISDALSRMQLIHVDAMEWLRDGSSAERPDVVYLDPMFPERGKSAQVRKEMQALQQIVGGDDDADGLLEPALTMAGYRVVVKRPRRAPPLAHRPPTFTVAGRSTRFDVYALRRMPSGS